HLVVASGSLTAYSTAWQFRTAGRDSSDIPRRPARVLLSSEGRLAPTGRSATSAKTQNPGGTMLNRLPLGRLSALAGFALVLGALVPEHAGFDRDVPRRSERGASGPQRARRGTRGRAPRLDRESRREGSSSAGRAETESGARLLFGSWRWSKRAAARPPKRL